jgi:bifunctional DNase/RNase
MSTGYLLFTTIAGQAGAQTCKQRHLTGRLLVVDELATFVDQRRISEVVDSTYFATITYTFTDVACPTVTIAATNKNVFNIFVDLQIVGIVLSV